MSTEVTKHRILTSRRILDKLFGSDFAADPAQIPTLRTSPETSESGETEFIASVLAGRSRIQFWELYDRAFMGNKKRKAAICNLISRGVLVPINKDERITELSHLTVSQ